LTSKIGGFQTKKCFGGEGDPSSFDVRTQTFSSFPIGHKIRKNSSGYRTVAEHAMNESFAGVALPVLDGEEANRQTLDRRLNTIAT
jgi:hypothetical protein